MFKKKSLLAALVLTAGIAQVATAQNTEKTETRTYPFWFIGVQGGGQAVLNGYKVKDVVTPIGAIQGGAYFSPALGARLQVNGWKSKEGIKNSITDYGTYRFDYVGANLDVLINLTNAFSKTDDHLFNVILAGGIGINKAWGMNYRQVPGLTWNGTPAVRDEVGSRTHNHVAHNDRIGLILDFRFNKNWSLNLEGTANHIGSRTYAINYNAGRDWQLHALVGLTYTFGKCKKCTKSAPVPAPAPVEKPVPAPAPKPTPAPTPEKPKTETVTPRQLAETSVEVFFGLAKTEPVGAEADKVARFAEWLRQHPTAKATVKGYADAGTGNPTINKRYAEQRAQIVKELLVKKYGIDASRLNVSSCGDTVQPKAYNDDNRVVIGVAKEQ